MNEEIAKIKGEIIEKKEETNLPLVDVETSIDESYVEEEELKIEIHKKISEIDNSKKLEEVKNELEDRFGRISDEMLVYMHEQWFEKKALKIGINNIKQNKNSIEVLINKEMLEKLSIEKIFVKVMSISKKFRFKMYGKNLLIVLDTTNLDQHFIYYLLELIKIIDDNINELLKNKKN